MSIILGHRGASGYAPENTLEAFRLAMDMGADGFELDVHLSKDGELIVMHDERVDRTTDGSGLIQSFTLKELKALDASNGMAKYKGAKVPTLGELYDLIRDTRHVVNVEIKTDQIVYPDIAEKVLLFPSHRRGPKKEHPLSVLQALQGHRRVFLLSGLPRSLVGSLFYEAERPRCQS